MGGHARAPGDRRADPAPHPELAPIASLVRHEHERWDGTGYPDGLAGKAIPIGSRIILACDAEAVEELRRGAGSQFDPAVVVALLQVLGAS